MGLDNVILVDTTAQSDATRLAADAESAPIHVAGPDDLFRLMYTSGTTDRPKGVMHTYGNFYWKNADHVVALGSDGRGPPARHRAALSRRRVRPAGHGRALGRRHDLHSSRLRSDRRDPLDRDGAVDRRLVRAGHAERSPRASRARQPRRLEHQMGRRRRRAHARAAHPRLRRLLHRAHATSTPTALPSRAAATR